MVFAKPTYLLIINKSTKMDIRIIKIIYVQEMFNFIIIFSIFWGKSFRAVFLIEKN